MPEPLDLELVRWKTADQITPEEASFLQEHYAELNQDEKDAFAEVLPSQEIEEDQNIETPKETPENPEEPKNDGFTFKTQEEMDAYIEKKLADREAARVEIQRREADANKDKTEDGKPKYVPDDYVAPSWNEALELASEIAVKKFQDMTKKQQEAYQEQQGQLQDISKGFEKEFVELSKAGKLPPLDSEEFTKVRSQIFEIGADNGKATIAEAYDLWSKIPTELGGGYGSENVKKQQLSAQKQRAGLQGGGNREVAKGGKDVDYKDLHNLSMDELIERARA